MCGLSNAVENYWQPRADGEQYRVLADAGFSATASVVTPYRRRGQLGQEQEDFNSALSRVRSTCEWGFGRLKVG